MASLEARRTSQEIITLLCAKGDGDSDLHSSSGKCLDFEGRALKRCGQSWEGVLPNFEETNIKPGLIQWLCITFESQMTLASSTSHDNVTCGAH